MCPGGLLEMIPDRITITTVEEKFEYLHQLIKSVIISFHANSSSSMRAMAPEHPGYHPANLKMAPGHQHQYHSINQNP